MSRPCFGFQWIGQPFSSCDNCGHPYWEHTHTEQGQRRDGTRLPLGRSFRRLISKEEAAACKAKWGVAA